MITKQDFDYIEDMIEKALHYASCSRTCFPRNKVSISINDMNFIVISLKVQKLSNDITIFTYENNKNIDSKWIIKQTLLDLSNSVSTIAYTYYPLTIEYSCNFVNTAMGNAKKQLILFSDNILEQSFTIFD